MSKEQKKINKNKKTRILMHSPLQRNKMEPQHHQGQVTRNRRNTHQQP
jgi:hypothetical protein